METLTFYFHPRVNYGALGLLRGTTVSAPGECADCGEEIIEVKTKVPVKVIEMVPELMREAGANVNNNTLH